MDAELLLSHGSARRFSYDARQQAAVTRVRDLLTRTHTRHVHFIAQRHEVPSLLVLAARTGDARIMQRCAALHARPLATEDVYAAFIQAACVRGAAGDSLLAARCAALYHEHGVTLPDDGTRPGTALYSSGTAFAVAHGYLATAVFLLSIDPHALGVDAEAGDRLLHVAARAGQVCMLRALLQRPDHCALASRLNLHCETALDCVILSPERGHVSVADMYACASELCERGGL